MCGVCIDNFTQTHVHVHVHVPVAFSTCACSFHRLVELFCITFSVYHFGSVMFT